MDARGTRRALLAFGAAGLLTSACRNAARVPDSPSQELIVLAAPPSGDRYDAATVDAIVAFHVGFALQAQGRDRVVVLADQRGYDRYAAALGHGRVAVAPMDDIWARDYSPALPGSPTVFRSTGAGLGGGERGQRDADVIQRSFLRLAEDAGLRFGTTGLLNDGGNIVEDGAGSAVLSRKFLRDNQLGETAAMERLHALGIARAAFIEAGERGGLEHADAVAAFVGPNTVIVNAYPDDPDSARRFRADLERGLPGVVIHEIVAPSHGRREQDARFIAACGRYTNAVVTRERVYLPQFGIPEDQVAVRQVRGATALEVVPVQSGGVCHMGGGVRRMSWQLRGTNAGLLLRHLGKPGA